MGRMGVMGLLLVAFCGCSYVRVYDKERRAGFSAAMPAWPWQDSSKVIDRVNVSAKTNSFTASVRGLNESEVTSTNSVNLVEAVTKGAIEGALKAVKP